jgi:hypothetical protein
MFDCGVLEEIAFNVLLPMAILLILVKYNRGIEDAPI